MVLNLLTSSSCCWIKVRGSVGVAGVAACAFCAVKAFNTLLVSERIAVIWAGSILFELAVDEEGSVTGLGSAGALALGVTTDGAVDVVAVAVTVALAK